MGSTFDTRYGPAAEIFGRQQYKAKKNREALIASLATRDGEATKLHHLSPPSRRRTVIPPPSRLALFVQVVEKLTLSIEPLQGRTRQTIFELTSQAQWTHVPRLDLTSSLAHAAEWRSPQTASRARAGFWTRRQLATKRLQREG